MRYYKVTFKFIQNGEICDKEKVIEAEGLESALKKCDWICHENRDCFCTREGIPHLIKKGRIWKVTMDGTAHLRNSEDKLVDREDMRKVMFVDALDMYDAEQVAYRIWEQQVVEEGWNDISIFRTMVDVPKHPMTGKEVA